VAVTVSVSTRLRLRARRALGTAPHATALNAAVRERLLTDNPARYVQLPRGRRPHAVVWTRRRVRHWVRTGERPAVAVWTPAQAAIFLAAAETHRLHGLWRLLAVAGLRRGEACGLRWSDIDWPGWALAAPASASTGRPVFNVLSYGAAGNGVANDAPAINVAIAAASATGGIVEFPAGTYLAGGSIHMLSHVTLQLDAGSTIAAAATGFDPPEPNAYSQYQDFGHSHFHDAVIWGEDLSDVGFTGSGTITGAGHLIAGTPNPGRPTSSSCW
jgi:hypothetical protein